MPASFNSPSWRPWHWLASGKDLPPIADAGYVDRVYTQNRIAILLSITLGYGFLYTCRLPLSVVKKPVIDSGILSPQWLGIIASCFSITYAVGKLANGFLADHANVRRFFSLSVLLSALINLAMLGTDSPLAWAILWGANGWFQGAGSPCSAVALSNWFSPKERGRYYGIFSSSHSLGEGLTFVGTSVLVSYFGWKAGFAGPGIFCVFVALGLYTFLRDRPETLGLPPVADWKNDHPDRAPAPPSDGHVGRGQFQVIRMPSMWVLGLASAGMYVSRYAINSWGMLYLQENKGYSTTEAGLMLGINATSGIVGSIAYGFISDKLFHARRPPVTLIFGVLEVLAMLLIFYLPPGHPILLTGAFLLFGFTLSGLLAVLSGLFPIDLLGRRAAGAALGFIGILSYLGNAWQEGISGWLIQRGMTEKVVSRIDAHGKTISETIRHYDFSDVIVFWIGASVASMLLAAMLWNAKVKE